MTTSTKTTRRKHARDYAPFKSVAAYVIFREDWTEVATVHAYFGEGNVVVTIYNRGEGNASPDCLTHSAGGYGYDRFTSALHGMSIDGHELSDHCRESIPLAEGQRYFPKDSIPPKGYHYANWYRVEKQGQLTRYLGHTSCYKEPGLDYLKALGYHVIQAC